MNGKDKNYVKGFPLVNKSDNLRELYCFNYLNCTLLIARAASQIVVALQTQAFRPEPIR